MKSPFSSPALERLNPDAGAVLVNACETIKAVRRQGSETDTVEGQAYAVGVVAGLAPHFQEYALARLFEAVATLGWDDPPEAVFPLVVTAFNRGLRQGWEMLRTLPKQQLREVT